MMAEKNNSNTKFAERKEVFRLAVRNLTRSKRRNVVLAIAIAFGFFVVTVIDGLTTGAVGNLEDEITELAGGTVLIGGYEKVPGETEGKYKLVNIIRDKNYITDVVNELHVDYKYCSRYTSSAGQLVFAGKKLLGTIYGRDFQQDKNLVESFKLKEGSLDDIYDENAIVMSEEMAEGLNVQLGDTVMYNTETIYGQMEFGEFVVKAIIKGNSFMSGMIAYANIETVNKLVGIPEGGYSTFTIFLNRKNLQDIVAQLIEEKIRADGVNVSSRMEAIRTNPSNIGRGIDKQFIGDDIVWDGVKYGVISLNDQIQAMKTVMNVIHIITFVILLVILLIVMVGIANTYRMVLLERIREIGTMRALGMSGKSTGRVFTTEALILSIIGAIAGLLVGIVFMMLLGIPSINNPSVQMFLYKSHLSFKLSFGTILLQFILMIFMTAVAVHGSAKKASKMQPAEALRTVK